MQEEFNGNQYSKIGSTWKYFVPGSSESFDVITQRIAVKYLESATESQKIALEQANNLTRVNSNKLGWYHYSKASNSTSTIFQTARACLQSAVVDKVDIKTTGKYYQTPNDPQFPSSWHLNNSNDADIDMPEAWDIQNGNGSSILIGLIDSGLDWAHEDLGMGTDGYQNIYLNQGENDWTNPNNPTSGNGVDDDNNGFIDDYKGWNFYDLNNDTRTNAGHGTHTAGIMVAKNNNNKGVSGIAGGWGTSGCKVITSALGPPQNIANSFADGLIYCVDMGANVINFSLGTGPSQEISDALEYADSNGVIIVAAAGNDNMPIVVFPANHPYVIAVGGTNENDTKFVNASYGTHLDVAAPAENIKSTQVNNSYGSSGGTSFASPQVTAVAALMLTENPCLGFRQIKDIITATADKVGGYYYNYDPLVPGKSNELGYGRLNAHKAIEAASQSYKPGIDLYMRDRFNDVGANAGYEFTWDFDESPDIWVRNNPDGFIEGNQKHEAQSFEFNPLDTNYVYVRIGNRGCTTSFGTEKLKLYRTVSSSNSQFPSHWDGTEPNSGAIIGSQTIPALESGESVILQFPWSTNLNIGHCLLARIENSPLDPIIEHPQDLTQDLYQNNNIALRNVLIHDIYPSGIMPIHDGVKYPFGDFVYVGNVANNPSSHDFVFKTPDDEMGKPLTEEAEVVLVFDSIGWDLFYPQIINRTDVRIVRDKTIRLLSKNTSFNAINFLANQRVKIYVGYSFLSKELTQKSNFGFHVIQKKSINHSTYGDNWTGSVHFYVKKYQRNPFGVNAGSDRMIQYGDITTLNATGVNEDAVYNWYDVNGNLVYTGASFNASPEITQKYKLEVIANLDGVKDYAEVEVKVNPFYISSISPNPANDLISVEYKADEATSAYLILVGSTNAITNNYILNSNSSDAIINISELPTGIYTVALVCDGVVRDAKQLIIQ